MGKLNSDTEYLAQKGKCQSWGKSRCVFKVPVLPTERAVCTVPS